MLGNMYLCIIEKKSVEMSSSTASQTELEIPGEMRFYNVTLHFEQVLSGYAMVKLVLD